MTTPTQHLSDAEPLDEEDIATLQRQFEDWTLIGRAARDLKKARALLRRCRDGIAWVAADELGHELAAFLGVERGAEKG